jgi:hypothetical protein
MFGAARRVRANIGCSGSEAFQDALRVGCRGRLQVAEQPLECSETGPQRCLSGLAGFALIAAVGASGNAAAASRPCAVALADRRQVSALSMVGGVWRSGGREICIMQTAEKGPRGSLPLPCCGGRSGTPGSRP